MLTFLSKKPLEHDKEQRKGTAAIVIQIEASDSSTNINLIQLFQLNKKRTVSTIIEKQTQITFNYFNMFQMLLILIFINKTA